MFLDFSWIFWNLSGICLGFLSGPSPSPQHVHTEIRAVIRIVRGFALMEIVFPPSPALSTNQNMRRVSTCQEQQPGQDRVIVTADAVMLNSCNPFIISVFMVLLHEYTRARAM